MCVFVWSVWRYCATDPANCLAIMMSGNDDVVGDDNNSSIGQEAPVDADVVDEAPRRSGRDGGAAVASVVVLPMMAAVGVDDNSVDDDGYDIGGAGSSAASDGHHRQQHSRSNAPSTSSNGSNNTASAGGGVSGGVDADGEAVGGTVALSNAVTTVLEEVTSEYKAQSIVNNIYASAESGFAISMYKLLANLVDDETRFAIVRQVSAEQRMVRAHSSHNLCVCVV